MRARLTLEGWYVRFMINPTGPTGLVTGLSAVKLHLAIRMILVAVKQKSQNWQVSTAGKAPAASWRVISLGNHHQSRAGGLKPLRIGETRDYHRFPAVGNKVTVCTGSIG